MQKNRIRTFHQHLHQWYIGHGRKELPWRMTDDPYAIYISEIMLQQTQVKTVLERFYFPFLDRFPTLSALAAADRDEVLYAWQGLGYYNRALNLHEAAKRCDDQFPDTVETLMMLPGIGRNTAHAVAAFAYRQPVAVMEANVRRVLSRVFALSHPDESTLWDKADMLLDRDNPFDYNQAMMDIGAILCRKRAPLCHTCPAQSICKGKDAAENYPAIKSKKTPPVRKKNIAILCSKDSTYYARPRTTRFLKGLYHFIEVDAGDTHVALGQKKYALKNARSLGRIHQQYSHFTLDADICLVDAGRATGEHWYSYAELQKLPVSMAERKIIALLAA